MAARCSDPRRVGRAWRAPLILVLAWLAAATAPVVAEPSLPALRAGERWVVAGARQDRADAIGVARTLARRLQPVHVVRAPDGRYVVITGPVSALSVDAARQALPDGDLLPFDISLSDGSGFGPPLFTAPPPPARSLLTHDGAGPVTRRFGALTVTLDSIPAERGLRSPRITGRIGAATVFVAGFPDHLSEHGRSEAMLIRLDPATAQPQVVFTSYSGGAHCCTGTRIATETPEGGWRVLTLADIDGTGYDFEDVDDDGHVELLGIDNSFLYAFASYAESWAPPVVLRVAAGRLRDVTREPPIRPYLRRQLREMEHAADTARPPLWTSHGFLAGWAAAKAQLGEVGAAWPRIVAADRADGGFTAEACRDGRPLSRCPPSHRERIGFAEALRRHLRHYGYPAP